MLDNLKTNYRKYVQDYRKLRSMPDGSPMDWLKKPWDGHAYVDMFVESSRAAPYLMGHFWAMYLPLSILAMVLL